MRRKEEIRGRKGILLIQNININSERHLDRSRLHFNAGFELTWLHSEKFQ